MKYIMLMSIAFIVVGIIHDKCDVCITYCCLDNIQSLCTMFSMASLGPLAARIFILFRNSVHS